MAVSGGIKQGSPTSGALWAIFYDLILRDMSAWIPPTLGRPTCYTGDVAVAARHIVRVPANVLASFVFAAAAALRLNIQLFGQGRR